MDFVLIRIIRINRIFHYERILYHFAFNSLQYIYDFCLVRTLKASANGVNQQLAAFWCHPFFVGNSTGRIFIPGPGESNWIYREWGLLYPDAAKSDSGSHYADYLCGVFNLRF